MRWRRSAATWGGCRGRSPDRRIFPCRHQPLPLLLGAALSATGLRRLPSQPRIAPRLDAIWGQEVTFADGTKRSVDDDYVRRSILQPGAHLVQGYAALMPSYRDKVSPVELASLIAYLHARSRTCTGDCGAERPTRAAVDPICKMAVVVTPETPKAERDGVTHYFALNIAA